MKVRQDFVTNSSSTSFILSIGETWSQENFLKALGIEGESPMSELFKQLYEAVEENKQEIQSYVEKWAPECENVLTFLRKEGFGEETIKIVEHLIASGKTIYWGELRSDGSTAAEVFFCFESFLVYEDNLYFNGRISGW